MDPATVATHLSAGLTGVTIGHAVMVLAGSMLMTIAVVRQYEPLLLLPIGFGCVLANIPATGLTGEGGFFDVLYRFGVHSEVFPLLIFIGVGAMIDFAPLLARPGLGLLGAAGQLGIFATLLLATAGGFPLRDAASIAVIGSIDGPTSIFVASTLAPHLLAPIAVAAYSYMSLVPVIQPPLMRLLTTPAERRIRMPYAPRPVSHAARVLFPVVATVLVGVVVPRSAPLVGMLMFGNLLRESGVAGRLSRAAQNELIDVSTLLLALTIGATMTAETFLRADTAIVLALGLVAFVLDTVGGLLIGKLACALSGQRLNPLIGAAGISAFPMAGRLAARLAQAEDPDNYLIMHAMAANTAGQLGSAVAGGVLLAMVLGA